MSEETYRVDLKCANCKRTVWNLKIPMGTSVEEFGEQENRKCEYCDCYIIKVKEKKEEKNG